MMSVEVTFPIIGEVVEKEIDVNQRSGVNETELNERLNEAKQKLHNLQATDSVSDNETSEAKAMLSEIINRFEGEKNSEDGKMHLLADLRRAFIKMEETEKAHEWDTLETELRSEFDRLEKANDDLGNKHDAQVAELRRQTDMVIRKQDVQMGRQVLNDINSLFVVVTLIYQLVNIVRHHSSNFNQYSWKDAIRARQLLTQGQNIIANNPSVEELHPLVCSVIDLLDLPESEKPKF